MCLRFSQFSVLRVVLLLIMINMGLIYCVRALNSLRVLGARYDVYIFTAVFLFWEWYFERSIWKYLSNQFEIQYLNIMFLFCRFWDIDLTVLETLRSKPIRSKGGWSKCIIVILINKEAGVGHHLLRVLGSTVLLDHYLVYFKTSKETDDIFRILNSYFARGILCQRS